MVKLTKLQEKLLIVLLLILLVVIYTVHRSKKASLLMEIGSLHEALCEICLLKQISH